MIFHAWLEGAGADDKIRITANTHESAAEQWAGIVDGDVSEEDVVVVRLLTDGHPSPTRRFKVSGELVQTFSAREIGREERIEKDRAWWYRR